MTRNSAIDKTAPLGHDPGGKVKLKLPENVTGNAIFSPCGRYRYLLTRDWSPALWHDHRSVLWIGMNPSTADAGHDDPTIRREIYFTMRLGYPRLIMANVMDWRATNPKNLLSSPAPRSEENIPHIIKATKEASIIIAAWGSLPPALTLHAQAVQDALRAITPQMQIFCLGFTQTGAPRHPLYLRSDAPLLPFPSETASLASEIP